MRQRRQPSNQGSRRPDDHDRRDERLQPLGRAIPASGGGKGLSLEINLERLVARRMTTGRPLRRASVSPNPEAVRRSAYQAHTPLSATGQKTQVNQIKAVSDTGARGG